MSQIQKTDFLFALYITAIVCAELLGSKVFTLFGIHASVAIFVYPLTFAINDIIVEVYGKERARSFVKCGFYILIFLFVFTYVANILPPADRFLEANKEYTSVFARSQRIILASLTAFWVSERIDVTIFSRIRERFGKKHFWIRTNISNFLSQFIDTTLFMFLAFYIPGSTPFIVSLVIPYWILKCVLSIVETPISYLGIEWLKKKE